MHAEPAGRTRIAPATYSIWVHDLKGAFRGYVRCDLDRQQWTSTYRVVDTALVPGATARSRTR